MHKIVNVSVNVKCSRKKAFEMFAHKEKVENWLCGKASIEAVVGGKYEVYNNGDKEDNTQGCKVLALNVPNYLMVEWKGPKKFADFMNKENALTQVTVLFHPKGEFTQVTIIHSGWGQGKDWHQAQEYFRQAWKEALAQLKTVVSQEHKVAAIGVTGLGGMFFKAKNPETLKEWYDQHLGFKTDQYGQMFRWIQCEEPQKSGSTQWSIMPNDTKYFSPGEKPYMLNYRVGNLVNLLEKLDREGVELVGEMEEFDYGKFGWVMDPEGNKIELWEPVDEAFDNY